MATTEVAKRPHVEAENKTCFCNQVTNLIISLMFYNSQLCRQVIIIL